MWISFYDLSVEFRFRVRANSYHFMLVILLPAVFPPLLLPPLSGFVFTPSLLLFDTLSTFKKRDKKTHCREIKGNKLYCNRRHTSHIQSGILYTRLLACTGSIAVVAVRFDIFISFIRCEMGFRPHLSTLHTPIYCESEYMFVHSHSQFHEAHTHTRIRSLGCFLHNLNLKWRQSFLSKHDKYRSKWSMH